MNADGAVLSSILKPPPNASFISNRGVHGFRVLAFGEPRMTAATAKDVGRAAFKPSPGLRPLIAEEPAGRPIAGQGRQLHLDRRAFGHGLRSSVLIDVRRGVAGI